MNLILINRETKFIYENWTAVINIVRRERI